MTTPFKNKEAKGTSKITKLIIKAGFDPTGEDLHLGHFVLLSALKDFQQKGHKIILVIGDFTATIGDPSGKKTSRSTLSFTQTSENAKTYLQQIFKILDPAKTKIKYNSKWLKNIRLSDILNICGKYPLNRILERRDFHLRISNNRQIYTNEILYPLLQAYDSVVLKPNIEIGGEDQLLNLLMAKDLMKKFNLPPQNILTYPLLLGIDGKNKMSKSLNNFIGISESSTNQFGKTMSIPDELMWHYLKNLKIPSPKTSELLKMHPKEIKQTLAFEIVTIFHGRSEAQKSLKSFLETLNAKNKKNPPENVERIKLPSSSIATIIELCSLASSKTKAKRLIAQGAVHLDGCKISDHTFKVEKGIYTLKVGALNWKRVEIL